jgi:hypothetical protein
LENTLRAGAAALIKRAGYYAHLEFHPIQFPSQLGFQSTFKTRHSTLTKIRESRDAFVALLAYFSWAISLYKEDYKWKEVLCENLKPDVWVDWILNSCACRFDTLRIGTIVQPSSYECIKAAEQLIARNVPVWIYWGPTLATRREITKDFPPTWVPTQIDLDRARFRAAPTPNGEGMADFNALDDGEYTKVTEHPPPIRGGGQKRGESMEEFFARRDVENSATRESETEQERNARKSREVQSRKCTMPAEFGSKMKVLLIIIYQNDSASN